MSDEYSVRENAFTEDGGPHKVARILAVADGLRHIGEFESAEMLTAYAERIKADEGATCTRCDGAGEYLNYRGNMSEMEQCHVCDGTGKTTKPVWRRFTNHKVYRDADSCSCYCWSEVDHGIGEEVEKKICHPPAQAAQVNAWNLPPCSECGAKTQAEAETMCICSGDKDDCHGTSIWPDDEAPAIPPAHPTKLEDAVREVARDIRWYAGNNNANFHRSWADKLTAALQENAK